MVVTLMTEEITTPRDQAAATGLPIAAIRDARRVVFYHADRISKELGLELDSEEEEVAQ